MNGTVLSPELLQPYAFTGREFDQETGLYYYRARYYDLNTGRFISKDPIGFSAGDVNLYRYVGNNPVNKVDPYGLEGDFDISIVVPAGQSPGAVITGGFRYHGNWCGPNWTGGQVGQYDPNKNNRYNNPIDCLDNACKVHDKCYYQCRQDYPCDKDKRRACMKDCNEVLARNAEGTGKKHSGLWLAMKIWPPDPGPNDSSCSCKK